MASPADPSPIAPWPAPPGAPVLLFGGTFDPPHRAHIDLALAARDALYSGDGWLVLVPAARNPLKQTGPAATDAQRLAMLSLAIGSQPRTAIWSDEIERAENSEPSYWIDTITRAAAAATDDSVDASPAIRFLIGADQAIAFNRWRAHKQIIEISEPAVMLRAPCPTRESFRATLLTSGLDPAEWMPRIVPTPVQPAASTDARATIQRGEDASALLQPAVIAYIAQHGLYTR